MNFISFGRRRELGFADAMIASFPDGLSAPEPLVSYFRWLESVGADRVDGDMRFSLVDPGQLDLSMLVKPVDLDCVTAWIGKDPSLRNRLAPFVRTGGDGSYAALWRDDSEQTQFVHLGSGSGSTLLCALTDDPVDFLRLLAIGYEELCWPDLFDKTPEEVFAAHEAKDEELSAFTSRRRMRAWVEATFDVIVPSKAREIVSSIADMDQDESDDPFWQWMKRAQGWDR
jgi:hypothetical protein